jgi:hypothetical protein
MNLIIGNYFYFQPNLEVCKSRSYQFNGLVNFVIFALTSGYIMSIYYAAIFFSIICGPQEIEENDSRNEVLPPRRQNQVSD